MLDQREKERKNLETLFKSSQEKFIALKFRVENSSMTREIKTGLLNDINQNIEELNNAMSTLMTLYDSSNQNVNLESKKELLKKAKDFINNVAIQTASVAQRETEQALHSTSTSRSNPQTSSATTAKVSGDSTPMTTVRQSSPLSQPSSTGKSTNFDIAAQRALIQQRLNALDFPIDAHHKTRIIEKALRSFDSFTREATKKNLFKNIADPNIANEIKEGIDNIMINAATLDPTTDSITRAIAILNYDSLHHPNPQQRDIVNTLLNEIQKLQNKPDTKYQQRLAKIAQSIVQLDNTQRINTLKGNTDKTKGFDWNAIIADKKSQLHQAINSGQGIFGDTQTMKTMQKILVTPQSISAEDDLPNSSRVKR